MMSAVIDPTVQTQQRTQQGRPLSLPPQATPAIGPGKALPEMWALTWAHQVPEAGNWQSTCGSRSGAPRNGARMGLGPTACRHDGDRKWVGESSPLDWGSPDEVEGWQCRRPSGWAWALREGGNGAPSGDEGLDAGAEGRNGWGPHASPWDTENSGGGWEGLDPASAWGTPGNPLPGKAPASPPLRNAAEL